MIYLPEDVARAIALGKHAVTAWRNYYGWSQHKLAHAIDVSTETMEKIESSNLHLTPHFSERLAKVFNIYSTALTIRYQEERSHATKIFFTISEGKKLFF